MVASNAEYDMYAVCLWCERDNDVKQIFLSYKIWYIILCGRYIGCLFILKRLGFGIYIIDT